MSNKILNFKDFKTGGKLSDPKTATSVKAAESVKKEKSIDQVKRADLTHPKITVPDYSKTVKNPVMEGVVEDNHVKIDDLKIQLSKLSQTDAGYLQKKRDIDAQIATLTKAIEDATKLAAVK
ncbi:hypothetical protein UFOVP1604_54 [uncultured Caudovirales phage]|uniref:Uncharacterized protein n=1 Tax=uncultured Caudovirales phage TaxID=2100421 RepID=A0A6J5SV85_9CAUD|nr:hypothetical protein UFOVP1604_54 [uncultured Caudovirales phage]